MAYTRISAEPYSRLAIWARRLALFALIVALLSIIVLRSGLVEIVPGLATFGGAMVIAVLAILAALLSFITIWRSGHRGLGYSVLAIFIATLLLVYPAYLGTKAYSLPNIADITTDAIDPPRFEAIARLRTRVTNPAQYAGLYAAEQQRNAYPDVAPLELGIGPKAAYDAALALVTKRRWLVIDQREPLPGRRDGRIEAVARTPVMGFRDDVVLRIRGKDDASQVDMRSASRYGSHDLGSNASRVQTFLNDLDEIVDAALEKEERKRPAQKRPAPKTKGQPTAKR